MEVNTQLNDNWVLNSENSDKQYESPAEKLVIDSITSKIIESQKFFNKNKYTNNKPIELNFGEPIELDFNVPPVPKKTIVRYRNYISKSQNWIGHVIELNDDFFTAKLEDLNNGGTNELAEFDIEDVSFGDRGLLKQGAVFYWSVGFANENGQHKKESFIRFKRAVKYEEVDFDNLMDEADDIYNDLNWE
jgi:hypothetical protein